VLQGTSDIFSIAQSVRCRSYWKLILAVVATLQCTETIDAFTPTPGFKRPSDAYTTLTHENITKKAHANVALQFMAENNDIFPGYRRRPNFGTQGFNQASDELLAAVSKPDFDEDLRNLASAHFDNEEFDAGNQRILDSLRQIRKNIRSNEMVNARKLTGIALHTLQDFYSHSNWIEMGNRDPHPQIGVEGVRTIDKQATSADYCCTDCSR
jgi:hypothetical protein